MSAPGPSASSAPPASGHEYAAGTVLEVRGGRRELDTVLTSASRLGQLVLVDYAATWCGPCRAMAPVLRALASEHAGEVAVLSVDCEATPENARLAAEAGISAFPTFHLHARGARVAMLHGADPRALRSELASRLRELRVARPPADLVPGLLAALGRVRAGSTPDQFLAAARTLLAYAGNALAHPNEPRYRRVKTANAAYASRLGARPGGKDALLAIGFADRWEAAESVLVMDEIPADLARVKGLLEAAVIAAERAKGDGIGPDAVGAGTSVVSVGTTPPANGAAAPTPAPVPGAPTATVTGPASAAAATTPSGAAHVPVSAATADAAAVPTLTTAPPAAATAAAPAPTTAAPAATAAFLGPAAALEVPASTTTLPGRAVSPAMCAQWLEKLLIQGPPSAPGSG